MGRVRLLILRISHAGISIPADFPGFIVYRVYGV